MSTLLLVQLLPDREAMARWAGAQGLLRATHGQQQADDDGYLLHALLSAAFGAHAPKPFVDRQPMRDNRILGYVSASTAAISELPYPKPLIARALGWDRMSTREMPALWRAGRKLSFEVRARPIVRSRDADSNSIDEIDIAPYRARREPHITREQAYAEWLARELARGGAASLTQFFLNAFKRSRVVRKTHADARRAITVEGPDAWFSGHLRVEDGDAFAALLHRGVGRHRAFGFGCLVIAPPGVLA